MENHEVVRGGRETILIAEDDTMVRDLARAILESAGYTTLLAQNGEEAIQVYRDNADAIDLILMDMVMPRMNGRAVYETLAEEYPVKVLFCSGYSEDVVQSLFLSTNGLRLVTKPYVRQSLLRAVRCVLDEA